MIPSEKEGLPCLFRQDGFSCFVLAAGSCNELREWQR